VIGSILEDVEANHGGQQATPLIAVQCEGGSGLGGLICRPESSTLVLIMNAVKSKAAVSC
jgi:hypothetical protein